MRNSVENSDNLVDAHVDREISNCLNLQNPKSFFLFAGAGSGKTRSLVTVLKEFREKNYKQMQYKGQRVAIITYTNAACEEIERRLDFDPIFSVSTIHSFIWELIKDFNKDIKEWLYSNLKEQIEELELKQKKGRAGTQAANNRKKSIEKKYRRLETLEKINKFTYNPNGDNLSRDSLNHHEVISIGSYFLSFKQLMQKILIKKFPVLLIDESQDTNKDLINAFFEVENKYNSLFILGLFGDTMQRIYSDGKVDLGADLPERWAKPAKIMNHRCPPRIIKLINKIRSDIDGQEQRERTDKGDGFVRMFIFPITTTKKSAERIVAKIMADYTKDSKWTSQDADYTSLILEHHMAANRLGFFELFQPIYQVEKLKTGLLGGTLRELNFFTQIILPMVNAYKSKDDFTITSTVRKHSPLIKLAKDEKDQVLQIKKIKETVYEFLSMWDKNHDPLCLDVLRCVANLNLFEIPDSLYPFSVTGEESLGEKEELTIDKNEALMAWGECLNAPFSQIQKYDSYINGKSSFMTHQGVKGLEFPRVMVIIDDNESRGFLFSYEKLFGAKEKTESDIRNENEGKDTSIDRTRRLFYVTCSRAEESLAIVAYSSNPESVRKQVLSEGWFKESEVEIIWNLEINKESLFIP
ncbi:UvrD-helicase domain-containing protein [Anaerobacillus isosaccharinicus]|uniref:ATP-dependent helicase n=1 Tax=Anaerobacillus isosaccharinicus TaxID=1532552 RepID=A0A1S2MDZ3_9BACI|nr:UvrD-helicase domain-containing protein [Anaerobacillus isosaccharinicus]MBA5585009.1 ATP-dependent helicase [Anaerobacillus isosaccharinicus]QOY36638.1 ATP-dependent helicase [Anaerobacillus isosaccharinicus]